MHVKEEKQGADRGRDYSDWTAKKCHQPPETGSKGWILCLEPLESCDPANT